MRKVLLPKGSLLRIEGIGQRQTIACQAGSCWITQEGDPQDYFLEAGKRLSFACHGLVVVEGITDGAICWAQGPGFANLTLGQE